MKSKKALSKGKRLNLPEDPNLGLVDLNPAPEIPTAEASARAASKIEGCVITLRNLKSSIEYFGGDSPETIAANREEITALCNEIRSIVTK